MSVERKNSREKRTYIKPKLRTIELASEEVLAVGCKILSGQTAVDNTSTNSCLTPTVCFQDGS